MQGCTIHVVLGDGGIAAVSDAAKPTLGADGKPTFNAAPSSVFSIAANFAQGCREMPGMNRTIATALALHETVPGSGLYEHLDNAFSTIDGLGCGNQGNIRSYRFTMELYTAFS